MKKEEYRINPEISQRLLIKQEMAGMARDNMEGPPLPCISNALVGPV